MPRINLTARVAEDIRSIAALADVNLFEGSDLIPDGSTLEDEAHMRRAIDYLFQIADKFDARSRKA